jgi:hypothetical protein
LEKKENGIFLEARRVEKKGEKGVRHGGEMAQTMFTHTNK